MNKHNIVTSIEEILNTFIVFGDPLAPYWLLGLEEGDIPGKRTIEEFVAHARRKSEMYSNANNSWSLRDLCGTSPADWDTTKSIYLPDSALQQQGGYRIKQQKTWAGYTKLLHAIWNDSKQSGKPWIGNEINSYQEKYLGECNEAAPAKRKSCLMELLPLPYQRSKGDWIYAGLAESHDELDYLESASAYQTEVTQQRVDKLLTLIIRYSPNYLICFGGDCRDALADIQLEMSESIKIDDGGTQRKASFGKLNNTSVIFSSHPMRIPAKVASCSGVKWPPYPLNARAMIIALVVATLAMLSPPAVDA